MRPPSSPYPFDRYLVQSNKQNEIFDIINEDIWNSEPALRPEDEIMLRKLHEMLQSTADDLKLLSGEIAKYREPGIQIKSTPVPLDEEFNEKVHIEEVVNAKFLGHKMIDQKETIVNKVDNDVVDRLRKKIADTNTTRHFVTTGIQVSQEPFINENKRKNLTMSRTKTIQINNKKCNVNEPYKENTNVSNSKQNNKPSVLYNEFTFSYSEPQSKVQNQKRLQLQEMPSVNIRSELKTQKVLQIDISPQSDCNFKDIDTKNNVAVITIQHKGDQEHVPGLNKQPIRKISKMATCESSESTNNIFSDKQRRAKQQKHRKKTITVSPVMSSRNELIKNKKDVINKQKLYSQMYVEQWKRKLNTVYGPSTSKGTKTRTKPKVHSKNSNPVLEMSKKTLNNADYIPYSKLTLGGVRVSDIENEIINVPNISEMPLSPILDKILSSRENSPRKYNRNEAPKVLTTSDENLLQEVLDIQDKVTNTLSENIKSNPEASPLSTENNSYPDDFDDEKTVNSEHSERQSNNSSPQSVSNEFHNPQKNSKSDENKNHNKTFTKLTNLSFKNSVDVYEYRHSIDTQDIATQSNHTSTISLKETQTSPRTDKPIIKPIHNDLWSTIDPKEEVEKLFKLEKDFIKKLIIDEYGDVLQKTINKPSTSNFSGQQCTERNIAASQKNTQTSPAHVKNVMTSPTRTKNRTTSPFILSKTVCQQTSPMTENKNDEVLSILKDNEDCNDISVNMSSPRFSLRLPQTSREVMYNNRTHSNRINYAEPRKHRVTTVSSSSSGEAGYSSDISSLGEVNRKYKQLLRPRIPSISELSSSSSVSKKSSEPSGMIPLRSEGEVSVGQVVKIKNRKSKRHTSDGEMSLGEFL